MSDNNICLIGLCGRSGSGKSFVARMLSKLGIPVVDTDAVYREMTASPSDGRLSECMQDLVREFGERILTPDLSLDRKALADIVFAPDGGEKRARLNAITHKYILGETDRRIAEHSRNGAWAAAVDAPLLFESGYDKRCDHIVAASAPEETLIKRIVSRDGLTEEGARRRLAVQLSEEEIRRRAHFIIETDVDAELLLCRVAEVTEQIRKKYASGKVKCP